MKQFIYLLAFAFMSVNATAQTLENNSTVVTISNLKVTQLASNLEISWNSNTTEEGNYWEVQASTDGKEFKAIGMVFGADPKNEGHYAFKQTAKNLKPGYHYYRVACVEKNNSALASDAIRLSK